MSLGRRLHVLLWLRTFAEEVAQEILGPGVRPLIGLRFGSPQDIAGASLDGLAPQDLRSV